MGAKTKEVGGGPTVGLADNYVHALQSLLNNGSFGTAGAPNPGGSTRNIFSMLTDIVGQADAPNFNVSPINVDSLKDAFATLTSKQGERDVSALRSRFGTSGGMAFGTPAAFAEGLYRSELNPKIAQGVGQLQLQADQFNSDLALKAATAKGQYGLGSKQVSLQALLPLLQQLGQFSSMGIAPRQLVTQKSGIGAALGTIAGVAGAALPFIPGVGTFGKVASAGLSAGMNMNNQPDNSGLVTYGGGGLDGNSYWGGNG